MEQRQYENENYRYEQQPPLTPQYYPVYPVYPAYYYPSPQNHYHSPMPPEHQYRLGAESLAAQLIESENEVHDLRRQLECLKQEKKESQQRLSLLERELHQKK
ncbi:MAG: hypothetical protein LRY69_06135 [Gammaproteobacteria bacterium]|nr:hypothetical protein [Gammaproteobacteria bacterium]